MAKEEYRIKYLSRKNPNRKENTDTCFSLVGVKSCLGIKNCPSIQLPNGRKLLTCDCAISSDKIRIRCPSCGHNGYCYLKGGVSDKNRRTIMKFDVFAVTGDLNEISIDRTLTCTSCLSQFDIQKGVMTKTGVYELPYLSDKELHEYMRKHNGFVDLNRFIEAYEEFKKEEGSYY